MAHLFKDIKAFAFGATADSLELSASEFLSLSPQDLSGVDFPFEQLKDKVILITNVASKCGFTKKNYEQLVELHEKFGPQGLEIVVFPCNQFGGQEPGKPDDIRASEYDIADKFNVKFPIMAKSDVNGENTNLVYKLLKSKGGHDIRWNFFSKFLVQCKGDRCNVYRFDGAPEPRKLEDDIVKMLRTLPASSL